MLAKNDRTHTAPYARTLALLLHTVLSKQIFLICCYFFVAANTLFLLLKICNSDFLFLLMMHTIVGVTVCVLGVWGGGRVENQRPRLASLLSQVDRQWQNIYNIAQKTLNFKIICDILRLLSVEFSAQRCFFFHRCVRHFAPHLSRLAVLCSPVLSRPLTGDGASALTLRRRRCRLLPLVFSTFVRRLSFGQRAHITVYVNINIEWNNK